MSHRFKLELQFWTLTVVWLTAGILTCLYSQWYWFILGWVGFALISSGYEFVTYKRRIVAHWERVPLWYNFLVHLGSPLLSLVLLSRLPTDIREWYATPKPRWRNYAYPGDRRS